MSEQNVNGVYYVTSGDVANTGSGIALWVALLALGVA